MVIKALIPLWQRHEITRICFDGIKRLQKKINISPVCIYSEQGSRELCDEYGFECYFHENKPLGKKMNFGLDRALESKWDYLIQIGSDDVLSDELFEIYQNHIDRRRLAFGVGCIYFFDVKTGQTARQTGMQVYGCGRMIMRDILDKENIKAKFRYANTMSGPSFNARKGQVITVPEYIAERMEKRGLGKILERLKDNTPFWDDDKESGLDFNSEFRLNTRGINVDYVDIEKRPMILDIKSDVNLHDITEYELVDFDVLNNFPEGGKIRGLV